MNKLIIGSHVDNKAPNFVLGAVQDSINNGANALMFYTGAPQNSYRRPIQELKGKEALELVKQSGIELDNIIVHAPYYINLANTIKPDIFDFSLKALVDEIRRTEALGYHKLVLHPGSHVNAGVDAGIQKLIIGLNLAIKETKDSKVKILIETMAGKGSEIGTTLEQVKTIIDGVEDKSRIGVCLDTCHLHDAGYDLTNLEELVAKIDSVIGLSYIGAIHVNDSKNPCSAHKDRHENIGFGYIGFATIYNFITHPAFTNIPKILETPYINEKAPYKYEIKALRENNFNPQLKEII